MKRSYIIIAFCGPSGVGKRNFILFLQAEYGSHFEIIRSPTTRSPGSAGEKAFFDFLGDAAFDAEVKAGRIIPSGEFRGKRCGLYPEHTREILSRRHGLVALTEDGIKAYASLPDFSGRIKVVLLQPLGEDVLRDNLITRGTPPEELDSELKLARFYQPPQKTHAKLLLRGRVSNLHALSAILFRQLLL